MVEVVGEGAAAEPDLRGLPTPAATSCGGGCSSPSPSESQRNETACAGSSSASSTPPTRRAALEREVAFNAAQTARLQRGRRPVDARPAPQPFRPTVELGLRFGAVMEGWLREQMEAAGGRARLNRVRRGERRVSRA